MDRSDQLDTLIDATLRDLLSSSIVADSQGDCHRSGLALPHEPLACPQYFETKNIAGFTGETVIDKTGNRHAARKKDVGDNFAVAARAVDENLAVWWNLIQSRGAPNFSVVTWPLWLMPSRLKTFPIVMAMMRRSSQKL